MNADPLDFWQLPQWQTKNAATDPLSVYWMPPQRQEPVFVVAMVEGWVLGLQGCGGRDIYTTRTACRINS